MEKETQPSETIKSNADNVSDLEPSNDNTNMLDNHVAEENKKVSKKDRVNKKDEEKLLNDMEAFEKERGNDANNNYKWFNRLGIILIVGEATIALCDAVFAGNKYVSYFLAILTALVGVITPILIFINYVKRFEINTEAKNAVRTLNRAYMFRFGIFDSGRNTSLLAKEFTQIETDYDKGKIEQIKQSSKAIENAK